MTATRWYILPPPFPSRKHMPPGSKSTVNDVRRNHGEIVADGQKCWKARRSGASGRFNARTGKASQPNHSIGAKWGIEEEYEYEWGGGAVVPRRQRDEEKRQKSEKARSWLNQIMHRAMKGETSILDYIVLEYRGTAVGKRVYREWRITAQHGQTANRRELQKIHGRRLHNWRKDEGGNRRKIASVERRDSQERSGSLRAVGKRGYSYCRNKKWLGRSKDHKRKGATMVKIAARESWERNWFYATMQGNGGMRKQKSKERDPSKINVALIYAAWDKCARFGKEERKMVSRERWEHRNTT